MKLDPQGSRHARDAGISRVMDGEEKFSVRVQSIVKKLPRNWVGIGEDIRVEYTQHGFPPPHHPNCWGGAINSCIFAGLLKQTGKSRHMRVKRSHARKSTEYRRA